MASTKTALASLQVEVQRMVDAVGVLAYLGELVLIREAARIRRLVERLEECLTAFMHNIRYTNMQLFHRPMTCQRHQQCKQEKVVQHGIGLCSL